MTDLDRNEKTQQVVVNEEGQFSIWPAGREIPRGWSKASMAGTKDECLVYIERIWRDMRPKSLKLNEPQ